MPFLLQACVKGGFQGGDVEVLTDKNQFLHPVAVLLVPVFAQLRVVCHELHQFLFGHGSEPLSCLTEVELFACLFEEVAHVVFFRKIAHAFASQHILRPMRRDELIE